MEKKNLDIYRKLSKKAVKEIEAEIKMMLHAHRDCLRNQSKDTTKIAFDCREGYYGEAFGIMRALDVLGYGYVDGAVNIPKVKANLKWWFGELEREVLKEEGFGTNNECNYCYDRYGKDHARRRYSVLDTNAAIEGY